MRRETDRSNSKHRTCAPIAIRPTGNHPVKAGPVSRNGLLVIRHSSSVIGRPRELGIDGVRTSPRATDWCGNSEAHEHIARMQDFRRLRVWQHAHEFLVDIKAVVRTFPKSVNRETRSQLIRAADSIASNIVEGCGAATPKEFARYLDISIKSASEVDYRLQVARDDGSLADRDWHPLATQVVRIRKMLFGLRRSVLDADAAERLRVQKRIDAASEHPVRDRG